MKTRMPGRRGLRLGPISRRDAVSFVIMGGAVVTGVEGFGAALLGMLVKLRKPVPDAVPRSAGKSIGSITQARNSATPFRNPHDGKRSLLVHLPGSAFVAYEQSCTHSGVLVDYDPATQRLVCPAHGAIFDPAQGGKVLQGPTTQALPQVALRIQADGTITAG